MSGGGGGVRVAIVGAGPGDPELLTLKAARWIAEAEDLLVDALVPAAVYQGTSARIVYVGKRAGRPSVGQRQIEEILVRLAKAGRKVVRLKGGDPCMFGRGGEEMRALEVAGVAYELVPGVSSALAAPAAAGIPVTDRGAAEGVTIVTGHRRADHPEPVPVLPVYVEERTVVVLMGLGSLRRLVEGALANGYPADLPAAVVSKATLPEQRTVAARLVELPDKVEEAGLETPATIVIGWVAARAVEKTVAAVEAIPDVAAGLVPAGRSVARKAASR